MKSKSKKLLLVLVAIAIFNIMLSIKSGVFAIEHIENVLISIDNNSIEYTGEQIRPEVTVKADYGNEKITLNPETDYDVEYGENINVGDGTITVTLKGNYEGENTLTFNIKRAQLPIDKVKINNISLENTSQYTVLNPPISEIEYTGEAIIPTIEIEGLTINEDYIVKKISNNIYPSESNALIEIWGIGNYDGIIRRTFKIVKVRVIPQIQLISETEEYTGEEILPRIKVKVNGEKYDYYNIKYLNNNINPGICRFKVILNDAIYEGENESSFEIVPLNVKSQEMQIRLMSNEFVYKASEVNPEIKKVLVTITDNRNATKTVELNSSDYEITGYENNINVGTGKINVRLKGNYNGANYEEFNIKPKEVIPQIQLDENEKIYSQEQIKPKVVSVKRENAGTGIKEIISKNEYIVKYGENTNAGKGTVTVSLKGNYTGTVTKEFDINPANLPENKITVDLTDKSYTGKKIEPEVKIDGLNNKTDFIVEYKNNINVGMAKIILKGKGNYTGTITKTFNIISNIKKSSEEFSKTKINSVSSQKAKTTKVIPTIDTISNQTYTGSQIKPNITVKINGVVTKNYTVQYGSNKEVGQGTVKVILNGNYTGENTAKFNIVAKKLPTVTVDTKNKEYTGKQIKPKVKIKGLKENTDYTVKYKNNIEIGMATIKITGIGNYRGSCTKKFKIVPPKITGTKITKKTKNSLTISWKKAIGNVSGYKIYLWNESKQKYYYYGKVQKGTSFTLRSLKNNKIFKIKVKAYKIVKGKQYSGERSNPFKGRTLKGKNIAS